MRIHTGGVHGLQAAGRTHVVAVEKWDDDEQKGALMVWLKPSLTTGSWEWRHEIEPGKKEEAENVFSFCLFFPNLF